MRKIYFIALLFITTITVAQDLPGYYITLSEERIEGNFKSTSFEDATSLQFRKSTTDEYKTLDPSQMIGYGIGTSYKFEKHTIEIDKSVQQGNNLSQAKEPDFEKQTVFLNTLLEGDATLYSYKSLQGTKYFYSVKSKNIKPTQLVYKVYRATTAKTAENNHFRQQLFLDLKCDDQTFSDFLNAKYSQASLMQYVQKFNTCNGSEQTIAFDNKSGQKLKFRYSVFAGVYNTMFNVQFGRYHPGDVSTISYGAGFEVAVIFPSERVEGFVSAEYEIVSADSKKTYDQGYRYISTAYEYDSPFVNMQIGGRYNLWMQNQNKVFVGAALGISLANGKILHTESYESYTGVQYESESISYELGSAFSLNFSAGYTFDKFGISVNFDALRAMKSNQTASQVIEVPRVGLNLKYALN